MKLKLLYTGLACAAVAFTFSAGLTGCGGSGGDNIDYEQNVPYYMQMTMDDFISGRKQIATHGGNVNGRIYVEPNSDGIIVSDTYAICQNARIVANRLESKVTIRWKAQRPTLASPVEIEVTFPDGTELETFLGIAAAFFPQASPPYKDEVGEDLEPGNYPFTLYFFPPGETFSSYADLLDKNNKPVWLWTSSGTYHIIGPDERKEEHPYAEENP